MWSDFLEVIILETFYFPQNIINIKPLFSGIKYCSWKSKVTSTFTPCRWIISLCLDFDSEGLPKCQKLVSCFWFLYSTNLSFHTILQVVWEFLKFNKWTGHILVLTFVCRFFLESMFSFSLQVWFFLHFQENSCIISLLLQLHFLPSLPQGQHISYFLSSCH